MLAFAASVASFALGVVFADKVKAALSGLKDKLEGKAKAELAAVEVKVKEKL